ncbi:MAG: fibronectin type III domain-containing protein, partial [Leptospira sp.]|nr:fibronectin type III domain-containing protein [Leptospira sp.]
MRKIFSLTTLCIAITFLSNCIGLSKSNGVKTSLGLLAFLTSGSSGASSGSGSDNPTPLPAPAPQVSEPPTIQGLPNGAPAQAFSVSESSLSLPASINNTLVPVGKVYDLGIDTSKLDSPLTPPALGTTSSVLFATPVQIQYNYDKAALKSSGFVEEFYVYYFDAGQNKWLPVKGVTVDTQNSIVTATTDHFTPFVLVAAPAIANTTAPAPPACIANDFPSGIGGHGGAKFTTVDLAAMFYQDRNYVFDSTAGAPTFNAFNNFGFRNALGISPCNGGAGGGSVGGITCQNADFPADHKFYPGNDYIVFTAHTNLDVYVIFEDIPNIPTWLKPAAGFVYTGQKMNNIVLSPMDFKIYRKTFLQGQTIQLGGGWNGTTNPSTNYTVILKRAGDTSQGTASNLCEATPDNAPPLNITNLKAIPGSTTAILQWENPDDPNFDGVVIRRGLGVSLMGQGVSPAGSSPNINTFRVTGLTQGNTYTFSVFALDKNAKWVKNTISVTTGPDGDSDNLSNSFETLSGSLYNFSSDKVLTDTDGDGIDDET